VERVKARALDTNDLDGAPGLRRVDPADLAEVRALLRRG
jgi:hypothetical protein